MKFPSFRRDNKQTAPVDVATDTQQKDHIAEAESIEVEKNDRREESTIGSPTQSFHEPSDASQHDESEKQETLTRELSKPDEILRSRGKVAIIMLSLCLAVFLAAIDITIITTALPTIATYFGSSAGYTWIGSAYLLGAASSTPIWGKFSDIFGRKPILLIANAVFFVGSLIAALSVTIGMLITARAIQGIGGGGLVVLVNICIGDLFSQRRRGAYYGIIGGVWAIASSLGPILGGVFTEKVTWRWCFYINLPIDGIAFCIIFFFLDLKTPKTPLIQGLKAIDFLGSLTIVGGTLMLLFGLQYGGETYPWDSATVICLIVFGIFTIGLFAVVETKIAKYPVIPGRIFKYRSNIACLCVCFVHGFVFISGSYYLPLYFQASLGATPLLSGVYILAQSVSLSVGSITTGIFIRKTGLYLPPILLGLCLMTLGYGLFIDLDRDSSWAKIFLYQIVGGLGIGPNFQAPLIALQTLVAPQDIAAAVGTFGFVRNMATAVSVVVGQVVFQNVLSGKSDMLIQALGPENAQRLGGGNAGANIGLIESLPPQQRRVAQEAYANSFMPMWIMYTAIAALGIVAGLLITKQTLQTGHKETETGLAAQEANRQEVKAGRDVRRNAQEANDAAKAGKEKGKKESV